MKKLSDAELATLRTAYAAMMVAMQRGRVPCGPELKRLMKTAWDLVRHADDPALAFHERQKASPILLPFGPGLQ